MTFIDDLLVERHDAEVTKLETATINISSPESTEAKERLRQYQFINLQQTLQENHWYVGYCYLRTVSCKTKDSYFNTSIYKWFIFIIWLMITYSVSGKIGFSRLTKKYIYSNKVHDDT